MVWNKWMLAEELYKFLYKRAKTFRWCLLLDHFAWIDRRNEMPETVSSALSFLPSSLLPTPFLPSQTCSRKGFGRAFSHKLISRLWTQIGIVKPFGFTLSSYPSRENLLLKDSYKIFITSESQVVIVEEISNFSKCSFFYHITPWVWWQWMLFHYQKCF